MKPDIVPTIISPLAQGSQATDHSVIDQELLVRFIAGERAAFNEVFDRLKGIIFWQVQRFFKGAFDQEEAMQEVWLKLYRVRDHFDVNSHEKFVPWAKAVARNQCIDLLKARGHHLETPMAEIDTSCDPDQLTTLTSKQTRAALDHFVTRLSPGEQRFFQLCFVQELPHEQVAELLSISPRRSKYLKQKLLTHMMKSALLKEAQEG